MGNLPSSQFVNGLPSLPIWIAVGCIAAITIYKYGTQGHDYFSSQGIPGPKPHPFVGTAWGVWRQNVMESDTKKFQRYGKVYGSFNGAQVTLNIVDADLIKSIFVRDFDHFVNRSNPVNLENEMVIRRMLIFVKDKEWKDVRTSITPSFTTGKIKRMALLIKDCADDLADKLTLIANDEGKIDTRKIFGAFTMDVIARCAFGVKIERLGQNDDPFVKHAQAAFNPAPLKTPLVLLLLCFPNFFMWLVGSRFFNVFNFFIETAKNMIKERKQAAEKYHDFIQVATETLTEAKRVDENGKSAPMWTAEDVDEIVVAQSTVFMLAGYDTTATTMTAACFLLARHPEIQDRLHQDIIDNLESFDGISYEMVQQVPYVDQVIYECLRLYPPFVKVERQCSKQIHYGGIRIDKDVSVSVSPYVLHRLEEYYPEPEKFDPDRWDPANKANRNPYAFMPFSVGPRNCLGMRFAMEELKIALCTLVSKFRFFPIDETPIELQFEKGMLTVMQPLETIVGLELRG